MLDSSASSSKYESFSNTPSHSLYLSPNPEPFFHSLSLPPSLSYSLSFSCSLSLSLSLILLSFRFHTPTPFLSLSLATETYTRERVARLSNSLFSTTHFLSFFCTCFSYNECQTFDESRKYFVSIIYYSDNN